MHSRYESLDGGLPGATPLPTYRRTKAHNKHAHTDTARVGFELTTSIFKRAKAVGVLSGSATVVGLQSLSENVYVLWTDCKVTWSGLRAGNATNF
jgi:hypothetical protein